ncbi:MAG: ATP-binding protein [Kiritimatiellae bacterium]|nr:ATP-binding protein [Kiritimatiellia bacterium]
MSEATTAVQPELPAVEAAPGERHAAIIVRGVQMPAHQVRAAIKQAVEMDRLSEEDGEEIFWLYSYSQEYHLKERDLADKVGLDATTLYRVFRGSYGAASWANVVKAIRAFKAVEIEEMKKKNIGIIETEVKKTVFSACQAALNDGMPAFIYGASQTGKTTALLEFQRLNNHGRTVYLRLGSGWTRPRLVRELAVKFGNGVKATKCWALEDAIFGSLTRYNLLIIDEFHLALETTSEASSKAIMEFIRETYDRTGCGLVMAATKVGLAGLEGGKNQLLFDQLRRRGTVKVVLPDVPPVRDINTIARSFDLPLPAGEVLADIKRLIKTRGLGVFIKYLQKAYAITRKSKNQLTWDVYRKVVNGYLALSAMKTEY